jgi:hypothetical protein
MSIESLLTPLLAQSNADGIWVLIPLAAICMFSTAAIVKAVIRHRERMAKIGMGIDPDAPGSGGGQSPDCGW